MIGFVNCGQPGEIFLEGAASNTVDILDHQQPPDDSNGSNPPVPPGTPAPGVNETINSMKPALAIRATGCIMCHSNIASTIITDFGYGNDYFFGGYPCVLPSGLTRSQGKSIYGDYDWSQGDNVNWGGSTLARGTKVVVPEAPTNELQDDRLSNVLRVESLAEYLTQILASNANAPEVQVKEVKSVFIGAPTTAKILSVADIEPGKIKFIPSNKGWSLENVILHSSGKYYTNIKNDTIICDGDLIIDSILWLNQPKIKTELGCRIYATKSVFINGPITYIEKKTTSNLQITSAKMVALGIGHSCDGGSQYSNSIAERLVPNSGSDNSRHLGFFTRHLGEPTEMLSTLKADADKISGLYDAECGPNGRAVGFERLMVNAPIVHNRYQGQFKGLMISEIALLALESLVYEFDPVFSNNKVKILPLFTPTDYLEIKE